MKTKDPIKLNQFQTYTREQVHDIFVPGRRFVPQAGTWGLHGIVRIPERPDDWVFFVTFGKSQAHHTFEERISSDGVLQWQSQPRQTLTNPVIKSWIHHDPKVANIYLFLRTRPSEPYWYLGRLAYVSHDPLKERPVYFTWRILDWDPPNTIRSELGLPENPWHLTAIAVRRHFSYVQKSSEDLTVMSSVRRFSNTSRGASRLSEYANGTTLAIRWPDLALWPLRKFLPDELKKFLLILPHSENPCGPAETAEILRSIALQAKASRHRMAATKINQAEQIGIDYMEKLNVLRGTQKRVTNILKANFPEFRDVFRSWRTKSALWVLEHYPSPADILARSTTEVEADLRLVTLGYIARDKAARLYDAADRALVQHGRESGSFRTQLEESLAMFRKAQDALKSIQTMQNTIQATGNLPSRQPTNSATNIRIRHKKLDPIRRTGGRYHTITHQRETAEISNNARYEVACRQYGTGWQVLLIAEHAREVLQDGTALMQVDAGLWLLRSLEMVSVDERQVSVAHQVLIFQLSDTATGLRGRRVKNPSPDSLHLLIARQELTIQGGEPAEIFNLADYQAALFGPNKAIHIRTMDGTDLLNVHNSTVVHLELIGQKIPYGSLDTPLFIGEFPAVTGDPSAPLQIIIGYEGAGSRNWRRQIAFDGVTSPLPKPPGKLGWFFVRFYDSSDTLLHGLDFRWVRDVKHLSWDAVHSQLTFSHDSSLIVDAVKANLQVDRRINTTRCNLPLGPEYDKTWWRITDREDVREYVEIPIRVPRIQWALGPENSGHDLQWTQEPLTLFASTIKPTSTQAIHISASREDPGRNPTVILWVGHNRLAPARLDGTRATIPLRNLTSYLPATIDQPLALQFTVAANGRLDNKVTLGQVKITFTCGRCSRPFDLMPPLQQHMRDTHPIVLKGASTYAEYYAMARQAGLADALPAKVYKCSLCEHTEVADNPNVNNATSAMGIHFNQAHRGGTRFSLSVVNDTAEIAKLFEHVVEPLGECSECQSVLWQNQPSKWDEHRDLHYSKWIVRS